MTIAEQTRRMVEENKQLRLKLREEKLDLINKEKQERLNQQEQHITKYINSNYEITNNNKDRIQSSILNEAINKDFKPYMNTQVVKEIILRNFGSITNKKTSGCRFYCGLKQKQ
jgi:tRNA U34 5-carboxymethylaminomethyl modifying enzyme MnmG/GidA